jgi:antitoxin component of MazEF toxin-antitoxin module
MLTVKTGKRNVITFPDNMLEELGLKDGDKVDVRVKDGAIFISKEAEEFFALEGALKDIDVETPLKELGKAWKKWNTETSL